MLKRAAYIFNLELTETKRNKHIVDTICEDAPAEAPDRADYSKRIESPTEF